MNPLPARLHSTVTQWFAKAGARPVRVSTCNSISATILTVLHGTAIGILPVRVMHDELVKRSVKLVRVLPKVPAHRVSICYQISEFGPGLKVLVDLTRELVAHYKLFV
jgi:DNA-binding transcriptional LysR family regulator